MKITGYQNVGAFFSGIHTQQRAKEAQGNGQGSGSLSGNKDTVMISLFGQNNSRIKELMEQKTSLLERKNELINSTVENGGDLASIKDRLDAYEEQVKELERQITQEIAGQNVEQAEKPQPPRRDVKPKTGQELEQERISGLVELSSGLSQAGTVRSCQTRIEGEARVLKSEIKMDKGTMGDTEIIAKKEEKLASLQQKTAQLASKAGEILGRDIAQMEEPILKRDPDQTYEKPFDIGILEEESQNRIDVYG